MSYNGFNGGDFLMQILAGILNKPIKDGLEKAIGLKPTQVDVVGALLVYTMAKNILSRYLNGYNLYPDEVFSLKQYVLAMNDIEVNNKVSEFLQYPSIMTARAAWDKVSESELRHFTQNSAKGITDQKK